MQIRHFSRRASVRGLTLIELVVVLAILVALAGLIIGNFPNLIKKASGSTSANTIQDISRAVNARFTTKNSYGSGYDSLLGTVGSAAAAFSNLPPVSITQIVSASPSAADATALNGLGLTNVYHLQNNGDATWTVADLSSSVPLTAAAKLATANTTLAAKLLGDRTNYLVSPTIYLFGVGKRTTLVGPDGTLLESPTRTGTTETENSQNYYQRYVIGFLVDGATTRTARFLGTLAPTSVGFSVTDDATQTYNNN